MMNKELLMDLIGVDIEKSCLFLLTAKPNAQQKQFKDELDKLKQDLLTSDYETVQKTTDYAVNNFLSQLTNDIKNHQGVKITSNHCLVPFLIYIKLFSYLKAYEINEQFILMMYKDLNIAKNFTAQTSLKIVQKLDKSEEMSAKASKRHSATKKKDRKNQDRIKEIWNSHNWKSYTECTDHIYRNNLIDELNHRKIYSLVSKAAKEKI